MMMRQIRLKLILDYLGVPCNISNFSDRIIPQKSIYMAQECGVDLGYYFGKYALGPYSPELECELVAMRHDLSMGDNEYLEVALPPKVCNILTCLKTVSCVPKYSKLDKEEWMTLLASVVYVCEDGDTLDDIKQKLCFDSRRMMGHVYLAVRVARRAGLIIRSSFGDEWE